MSISTAKGDDGTTGLFGGGRVRKDSPRPEAYGQVDEAQAFIGVARAHLVTGTGHERLLVSIERDLYVVMAHLATDPSNHHKLVLGTSLVSREMVERIGSELTEIESWLPMPTEFVIPGGSIESAHLDVARTVVRRAERAVVGLDGADLVVAYLNRLSDLLWVLARAHEDTSLIANQTKGP
jgi:cob(I)alamin adenosyltransferase